MSTRQSMLNTLERAAADSREMTILFATSGFTGVERVLSMRSVGLFIIREDRLRDMQASLHGKQWIGKGGRHVRLTPTQNFSSEWRTYFADMVLPHCENIYCS